MKISNTHYNKKSQRGFALLFAVLLASFLITLGISIFSISLKEIQMTTSSRDSQVAYYAADSALECANYYDRHGAFPTCRDSDCSNIPDIYDQYGDFIPAQNSFDVKVNCNNSTTTLTFDRTGLTYSTYNQKDSSSFFYNFFQASSTSSSTPVADISITKEYNKNNPNPVITTIQTYGHNTSILGRRVERGIQQITQ